MTWDGWTVRHGRRKADVVRSHGCWLALEYTVRGQIRAGEYFSYGEPGALAKAKAWCEARLRSRSRYKGRR